MGLQYSPVPAQAQAPAQVQVQAQAQAVKNDLGLTKTSTKLSHLKCICCWCATTQKSPPETSHGHKSKMAAIMLGPILKWPNVCFVFPYMSCHILGPQGHAVNSRYKYSRNFKYLCSVQCIVICIMSMFLMSLDIKVTH